MPNTIGPVPVSCLSVPVSCLSPFLARFGGETEDTVRCPKKLVQRYEGTVWVVFSLLGFAKWSGATFGKAEQRSPNAAGVRPPREL